MKIIFLDFDGVLNNAAYMQDVMSSGEYKRLSFSQRSFKELDPTRVKMVSDLALETDADIVVSSSWRILSELSELREYLQGAGMDENVLPIARTPITPKGFRGEEVKQWLDANTDVSSYVIFDDDGDFYPEQMLVQTSWNEGLLPEHVERARKILLNEKLCDVPNT